ncbi:glycosyltransferase family 2 protein [bacterium]|nr:glycosyltransferase family 2 protein [bacterium]
MPESKFKSVSVIVPVYKGSALLDELIDRISAALGHLVENFEILLINDASPDSSWEKIQELADRFPYVRGVELMRNYGQHNAVLCGIRAAKYELTVTLDDDLQHPPEEIAKLFHCLESGGHDVVYGVFDQGRHGLLRDLASRMTKLAMQSAMGVDVATNVGPFRIFRTCLRDAFSTYRSQYISIDVLLTWGSSRFGSVKVRHDPRRHGQSSYTFGKLMIHALNMVTGYSTLPLQLSSLMGFCFTGLGLTVLLYVIFRFVVDGNVVPGFPFLASIIAIFSGAQLFALGIIGEYLARVHLRTMDRPSYTIRDTTPNAGNVCQSATQAASGPIVI